MLKFGFASCSSPHKLQQNVLHHHRILPWLLIMSLQAAAVQPSCSPPLPSLDTVVREAVYAGGISSRDIQQRLVPSLKFTCTGNITRWTIIAKTVGGGSRFPQFSVWRSTGGDSYERVDHSRITEDSSSSPQQYVYDKSLGTPLAVQEGYIVGIYTPPVPRLTFKYQSGGGPTNYYIGGISEQKQSFSLSGAGVLKTNEYPLVSVEVSPPECAEGFISRDTLLAKAAILLGNSSDLAYREATQRLFPELSFPCTGWVLSFSMAALFRAQTATRSNFPELQIWQRSSDEHWSKRAGVGVQAAVSSTNHLNVYRYSFVPPIPVQRGDVLGLYQPYSSASVLKLYLQENAGAKGYYQGALSNPATEFDTGSGLVHTDNHLPLITAEISMAGQSITMTIQLTSTPSQLTSTPSTPSQLTSTPSTPSQGTHTTPAPSLLPPSSSFSSSAVHGLVAGIVLMGVCLVGSVAAVVISLWRRRLASRHPPTLHSCNPMYMQQDQENSMEYNSLYRPINPTEIITSGQRLTLNIKENEAYGEEKEGDSNSCQYTDTSNPYEPAGPSDYSTDMSTAGPSESATRASTEHIYESID